MFPKIILRSMHLKYFQYLFNNGDLSDCSLEGPQRENSKDIPTDFSLINEQFKIIAISNILAIYCVIAQSVLLYFAN